MGRKNKRSRRLRGPRKESGDRRGGRASAHPPANGRDSRESGGESGGETKGSATRWVVEGGRGCRRYRAGQWVAVAIRPESSSAAVLSSCFCFSCTCMRLPLTETLNLCVILCIRKRLAPNWLGVQWRASGLFEW